MKKLSILAIAFVVIALAACEGKKATQTETAEVVKSFDQQQIEANIKLQVDSIAAEIGKLKQFPFLQKDNKFALTKEEKQVKPEYLLDPSVSEEAVTLSEKYRILSALNVDRKIAELYEMPTDAYDKAITRGEAAALWNKLNEEPGIGIISPAAQPSAPIGIFRLDGVRVDKAQHGVYIIDGKKKLVK